MKKKRRKFPIILMFSDPNKIYEYASKNKLKWDNVGFLTDKFVAFFYLKKNNKYAELRREYAQKIEYADLENDSSTLWENIEDHNDVYYYPYTFQMFDGED